MQELGTGRNGSSESFEGFRRKSKKFLHALEFCVDPRKLAGLSLFHQGAEGLTRREAEIESHQQSHVHVVVQIYVALPITLLPLLPCLLADAAPDQIQEHLHQHLVGFRPPLCAGPRSWSLQSWQQCLTESVPQNVQLLNMRACCDDVPALGSDEDSGYDRLGPPDCLENSFEVLVRQGALFQQEEVIRRGRCPKDAARRRAGSDPQVAGGDNVFANLPDFDNERTD
mmetsp:Transcript_6899/g.15866  ORF Transcript_6899/g.15866 Transcript_6899/m.15866 type:complete len:227 (+) Transcript_6899:170-850(+)